MIDLYFWTTPNGYKPLVFLEEAELDYKFVPIDIGKGEQFDPNFLKVAPNNRIPAIVDHAPEASDKPISIFESGAILLYLADKTGKFIPQDTAGRNEALQWLFWQMGGLGPMLGQHLHFSSYVPDRIPYAMIRYRDELMRLYSVMDKRLADREFLAGRYSIADMASYPWIHRLDLEESFVEGFENINRWYEDIKSRSSVERAYSIGKSVNTVPTINDRSREVLFGRPSPEKAA